VFGDAVGEFGLGEELVEGVSRRCEVVGYVDVGVCEVVDYFVE